MQRDDTQRPAGLASASPRRPRSPRLRRALYTLLALTVLSSGLAGYRIGLGESARRRSLDPLLGGPAAQRITVASLQPTDAPTTLFDRLSLYLRVPDAGGAPIPGAAVTLTGAGGISSASPEGTLAFTELPQGEYTLALDIPGAGAGASQAKLTLLKTQNAEEARMTRDSDGAYTLVTAPSASHVRLDLRLRDGSLAAELSAEEPIALRAYQLWQRDTPVHLFDEREGNRVVTRRDGVSVIAPGSGGSFIFVVENADGFPKEFRVTLTEEFEGTLRLPMRYRLRDDVLRVHEEAGWGEWLRAGEVLLSSVWIGPDELRYYTLQWMWDPADSALDTAIGTDSGNYGYRLRVNVTQTIPQTDNLHL